MSGIRIYCQVIYNKKKVCKINEFTLHAITAILAYKAIGLLNQKSFKNQTFFGGKGKYYDLTVIDS